MWKVGMDETLTSVSALAMRRGRVMERRAVMEASSVVMTKLNRGKQEKIESHEVNNGIVYGSVARSVYIKLFFISAPK